MTNPPVPSASPLSIRYSPSHLYSIVSDVDSYSKFLPYCLESVVLGPNSAESQSQGEVKSVQAKLTVGFGAFKESYVSKVEMKETEWVKVSSKISRSLRFLLSIVRNLSRLTFRFFSSNVVQLPGFRTSIKSTLQDLTYYLAVSSSSISVPMSISVFLFSFSKSIFTFDFQSNSSFILSELFIFESGLWCCCK